MTTAPTVTVCIPMYNNAATISRCLDSVLDQEGVDFEIVVVDDESSDDSAEIVAAALRPGDRLIRNTVRRGVAGNHNRCLELARGEYVQFVHADDWLLPGALQTLAHELDASRGGMAWAPRKVLTEDTNWLRLYGQHYKKLWGLRNRNDGHKLVRQVSLQGIPDNWIGEPTCVMFRRQVAVDAGGFREDLYQLLDLDLWLRLMLRGTACFVLRELSVRTHTSATETVRNRTLRRDWLDQLRVITTMAVDPMAPTDIRIINRLWWIPIWIGVLVQGVALGPQRIERLKTALLAPRDEFGRARTLFEAH